MMLFFTAFLSNALKVPYRYVDNLSSLLLNLIFLIKLLSTSNVHSYVLVPNEHERL